MKEMIAQDLESLASMGDPLTELKSTGQIHRFLLRPDSPVLIDVNGLDRSDKNISIPRKQWCGVNNELSVIAGWKAEQEFYRFGLCRYLNSKGKITFLKGVEAWSLGFSIKPATNEGFENIVRNFGITAAIPFDSYFLV